MERYEVIIVGSGPAGTSTAIHLTNLDPALADRVLLLDKATFPRGKVCAGGVTSRADSVLEQLGVNPDAAYRPVHVSKFVLPTGTLTLEQDCHFRVLRREDFDDHLVRAAQRRGVVARGGEAVERICINPDGVVVRTSKNEYGAKIVIGADGANSMVRRSLGLSRSSRVMMAMEAYAPISSLSIPGLTGDTAIFDFTPKALGLPGYCWVFPAVRGSGSEVSLGIINSSFNKTKGTSLKSAFTRWLDKNMPSPHEPVLQAHPTLRYEPREACSRYRALLVGDAVGTDPLFGEGISSALAMGVIAAQYTHESLRKNDFNFSDYERRIRHSTIGNMMRRRRLAARRYYDRSRLPKTLEMSALLGWISPTSKQGETATIAWEPTVLR